MSTQAYYKERLGFDPADTVAEHRREQSSQHGYEESLSKFKGQRPPPNGWRARARPGPEGPAASQAHWGCWAMFIEAHGECRAAASRGRTLTRPRAGSPATSAPARPRRNPA